MSRLIGAAEAPSSNPVQFNQALAAVACGSRSCVVAKLQVGIQLTNQHLQVRIEMARQHLNPVISIVLRIVSGAVARSFASCFVACRFLS
jgi:hypothetical protein